LDCRFSGCYCSGNCLEPVQKAGDEDVKAELIILVRKNRLLKWTGYFEVENLDKLTLQQMRQGVFWEKLWELSDPTRKKRIEYREKTIRTWNKRAQVFARNTDNENNKRRRKAVFKFLRDCGVDLAGATILDIGAGPGNYAIPMAREAKEVVVLDPAVAMLEIIQKRAKKEGLTNISYSSEPWEEVDLDRLGWRKKFDLVFASVSPGVRDVTTLKRMMEASRKYCYISKFAGPRSNNIQDKIWQRLFEEPRINDSMEIYLPWNLLYAWGYYPDTKFIPSSWSNIEPIEQVEQRMVNWFCNFEGVPQDFRQVVRQVLEEEAVDGLVKEEVRTTFGLMVWQVQ
jgi:SAM-dependent methyltransferase